MYTGRFLRFLFLSLLCMNFLARAFSSMSSAARSKIVLPAPSKTSTHTLIFLHGLGDTADGGWSEVLPELQVGLPNLKVILPQAPSQPVTLNGGMRMPSWHDIKSLTQIDSEEFQGLEDSRKIVEDVINEEIKAGTPSKNIVLGGFSQGAALSIYTGLQFKEPLAGILSMSGYLPYRGDLKSIISDANKSTPLFFAHGEIDQVVRYVIGQRSHKVVAEARSENVEFKSYKGVGHHSSDEEMRDVAAWLTKRVA